MNKHTAAWIEALARLGYAAKGTVYITVGVLATLAALNLGGETTSSSGALVAIAEQPFGQLLLCVVAAGLISYALWRLVQAILDPEAEGTGVKAIIRRLGYAGNGIAHAGLAFTAIHRLADGSPNRSNGQSTQFWIATLMSQPLGEWLVGTAGAFMLGLGGYFFYRAFTTKFREKLKLSHMSSTERRWATRIGIFGMSARGIVFIIIGFFLIQAARQADPSEVRTTEGALDTLQHTQPFGPLMFWFVAVGLIAYGVHMLFQARYRRIQPKL